MVRPMVRQLLQRIRLNRGLNLRKDRRGVALLMAISTLAIITYIAMEVMYDSNVEYTVNSQSLNRMKAYYAARSGLELSLLRIKIYQSVMGKLGKQAGGMQAYIDQIWQFPFSWPMKLPSATDSVDKDEAKKISSESFMDGSFDTDIQDEGSRMDLADLVSPSKSLRDFTHKRLVDLFKNRSLADENWRNKYNSFNAEELINNIADWMSDKNTSLNGGDKRSGYEDLNRDRVYYPPNRAFITLDELRLVKGMNDDFFDLISPQVTIYGMRGINPNVASKDVIQSLDPGIDDRVFSEIEKRRSDPIQGPFKDSADFWNFVVSPPAAARLVGQDYKEIPLYFETLISFRITVQGHFGDSNRQIVAIVTDLDRTASRIKEYMDKDKAAAAGGGATTTTAPPKNAPTANNPLPKGPPRIVYWSER